MSLEAAAAMPEKNVRGAGTYFKSSMVASASWSSPPRRRMTEYGLDL
jgi:hypothetical protein